MISKVSVENRNLNSKYNCVPKKNLESKNPSFKAGGALNAILWGIQECEKNPMINVAVIDMFSAILPRTFVESMTNWFAGFEALRRESSGLIVNCLIPSAITMGIAALLNDFIMPLNSNMSNCWADNDLIQRATDIYKLSKSDDKVKDSLKQLIANSEGTHGKNKVLFSEILSKNELNKYAEELKNLSKKDLKNRELKKEVERIATEIAEKTHVYENITVKGGKEVKASTIKTLLLDSVKYFREFGKANKYVDIPIEEFAKNSKRLVGSKSALGMLVVLPLAASMQYINRWITEKTSGVKGAPIYEDFGVEQNEEVKQKSKEGLLKQKIISIGSMLGVGLASMMKMPSWSMFQFKGPFPTMDQARIISTTTFASRMAAADDKNELAEATTRDIATFLSLYFLGDYAAKAAATVIENKTGVMLLNDTKPIEKDANIFKKFWHWMKDVHIKSSEEVISKTKEALKGAVPTKAQEAQIAKEIKQAVNLRSACQVANLGVSLILLGLVIPFWTRSKTKKKHAEALKLAEMNSSGLKEKNKETEDIKPVKVPA